MQANNLAYLVRGQEVFCNCVLHVGLQQCIWNGPLLLLLLQALQSTNLMQTLQKVTHSVMVTYAQASDEGKLQDSGGAATACNRTAYWFCNQI